MTALATAAHNWELLEEVRDRQTWKSASAGIMQRLLWPDAYESPDRFDPIAHQLQIFSNLREARVTLYIEHHHLHYVMVSMNETVVDLRGDVARMDQSNNARFSRIESTMQVLAARIGVELPDPHREAGIPWREKFKQQLLTFLGQHVAVDPDKGVVAANPSLRDLFKQIKLNELDRTRIVVDYLPAKRPT